MTETVTDAEAELSLDEIAASKAASFYFATVNGVGRTHDPRTTYGTVAPALSVSLPSGEADFFCVIPGGEQLLGWDVTMNSGTLTIRHGDELVKMYGVNGWLSWERVLRDEP